MQVFKHPKSDKRVDNIQDYGACKPRNLPFLSSHLPSQGRMCPVFKPFLNLWEKLIHFSLCINLLNTASIVHKIRRSSGSKVLVHQAVTDIWYSVHEGFQWLFMVMRKGVSVRCGACADYSEHPLCMSGSNTTQYISIFDVTPPSQLVFIILASS